MFHALARRLLSRNGNAPTPDMIHDFVRERVEAERRARRTMPGHREDIELRDIYAAYPSPPPFGIAPDEIMQAELDMERECLRPIPAMREEMAALRRQGARIVYVSDMFLPESFVADRLREHGFLESGDRVYVSGTRGETKHTGNLFRRVLYDLGLAPGNLLHTGDNPHTDVAVPRSLGIRARHATDAILTGPEQAMLPTDGRTSLTCSALAGAARLARLSPGVDGTDFPAARVAADVAGPAVAGFVAWVLDKAREQGIKRLWFVARDGQIMHKTARELLGGEKGPECRYLYGSRQAWFLPSITEFSPETTEWLVIPGHCSRPASIVAKLDCTPEEIEDAAGIRPGPEFWETRLCNGDRDRLAALLRTSGVRRLVEAKARDARQRLVAYLEQEGVVPGKPVTLVDVGWTLKAQQALGRVLKAAGMDCPVSGFYFGVSQSALTASRAGAYQAYFLERDAWFDRTEPMNFLFRNANFVEQVMTAATHGQTTGYARDDEGRMQPVLRPDARTTEDLNAVCDMQARVLAFTRQARASGALDNPDAARNATLAALRKFLSDPNPDMARAVADRPVFDDQNETRRRVLARPVSLSLLARLAMQEAGFSRFLPDSDYGASFDWIEGAIALSPRWMRPLLRSPRMFQQLKTYRKSL